jgi:cell wall-associated NlpC family hydrolase
MPKQRFLVIVAFVPALLLSASLHAKSLVTVDAPLVDHPVMQPVSQLPVFNPSSMLSQATLPNYASMLDAGGFNASAGESVASSDTNGTVDEDAPAAAGDESITDLRKSLIALAMKLRDIRYVRGGHSPSTGFDCSGFVRYVFAHAVGLQLPTNSASQFMAGLKIKRADMKPGDLVFFHTMGKRRITHVGIYIADGQFIHSPTSGKSVQISSLDNAYWARHFAGAKRPEALAMAANNG